MSKFFDFNLSTEAIDFQKDKFGKSLEAVVDKIMIKLREKDFSENLKVSEWPESAELTKLIFDRLKLKVKLVTNEPFTPLAILCFFGNKNHILLPEGIRDSEWPGLIKENTKNILSKKGGVDLSKAIITGFYTEVENIFYCNFHLLKTFTTPEIVAGMLHEFGHAFGVVEFSNRMDTANQVLSEIAKEIFSDSKVKNKEYIFKEIKNLDSTITEKEIEQLNYGDKVVAGKIWFKIITSTVKSQLANSVYDRTSSEQLADGFAVRFGYSKELTECLHKIHVNGFSPDISMASQILLLTIEIAFFVITAVFFTLIPITPLPFAYAAVILFSVVYGAGEATGYDSYDKLKERFIRIRNEAVTQLKNANLSDDQAKKVLENLKVIDNIIKNTRAPVDIFRSISNFIFPSNREAVKSKKAQRLLEDLANNDLFAKSHEFKLL